MNEYLRSADLLDRVVAGEPISKLNRSEWEKLVLSTATQGVFLALRQYTAQVSNFPPDLIPRRHNREYQILQEFHRMETKMSHSVSSAKSAPPDYIRQKGYYLKNLAQEIKVRNEFYLLPKLRKTLDNLIEPLSHQTGAGGSLELIHYLLQTDLIYLYLLVCDSNRFLVGVKGGPAWQRVNWPGGVEWANLLAVGSTYLANLEHIGRREAMVFPIRIMDPKEAKKAQIPQPARPVEELLEYAFYHQRYIIHPEGVEVRLKRGGDIQKVIIVQSGDYLFAKSITPYGEGLLVLNLENLTGFSMPDLIGLEKKEESEKKLGIQSVWLNVLAEIYRDAVTAIERPRISVRRSTNKISGTEQQGIELNSRLGIIYIPRVVRVGEPQRPPYEGPERPITPHRVSGHIRQANMTETHRQKVIEFERENGIKILDKIPDGYTFVRPFVVPTGTNLMNLPVFIKRRIETELVQSFNLH